MQQRKLLEADHKLKIADPVYVTVLLCVHLVYAECYYGGRR